MIDFTPNRPYDNADDEVLLLSFVGNKLLVQLQSAQMAFSYDSLMLSDDILEIMSGMIMEFAEDIFAGIGIWKVYEEYNRSVFHNPLPYSLPPGKEMPDEQMNKYRIHHFLWNLYLFLSPGLMISPTHVDLHLLAEGVYHFFNTRDNVDLAGFYSIKHFLSRPHRDGGDVKRKLMWLGRYSYFFRLPFKEYSEEHDSYEDLSRIDDFLCRKNTIWSGLGVIDILADILSIEEERKRDIKSWYEGHYSYYKVESCEEGVVKARNLVTKQGYSIKAGSIIDVYKKDHIFIGSLIPWDSLWYWSGRISSIGIVPDELVPEAVKEFVQEFPRIIYRFWKEPLERARNIIRLQHQNFIEYHGDDLIVFPDGYAMAAAFQKQHRREYEAQPKEFVDKIIKEHHLQHPWPNYSYPQELLESERGIGVFFNPFEGPEVFTSFNYIVRGFEKQGKDLTTEEMRYLRGFIESELVSPAFVQKLAALYGSESISAIYLIHQQEGIDIIEYLTRKYKGHFYRNRYPNLTLT